MKKLRISRIFAKYVFNILDALRILDFVKPSEQVRLMLEVHRL